MNDNEITKAIEDIDDEIKKSQLKKEQLLSQLSSQIHARDFEEFKTNLPEPFELYYNNRRGDPLYDPYWVFSYGGYRICQIDAEKSNKEIHEVCQRYMTNILEIIDEYEKYKGAKK